MLFPKRVREMISRETARFNLNYSEAMARAQAIVADKAQIRDTELPVHFRQSMSEQLGVASSKVRRLQSLLEQLNMEKPQKVLLEKIIEECSDAANYLHFISGRCIRVIKEDFEGDTT